MPTISLCMIVKNESAVLRRCLVSIADLMDEIIIVDTGSTDNTKEIAAQFTDKIYDYTWENDFAAARNFAFSKATMDYIYSADADEEVDYFNHKRFARLKEALLPEIEVVQMYYVTSTEFNTTSNFTREYRPKLYKRLRTFTWQDAVHETVRLEPVIYDSDIEISHRPKSLHSHRDFEIFQEIFEKENKLSPKLHSMYAKELFISGGEEDFLQAENVFSSTLELSSATDTMHTEAICVLCHIKMLKKQKEEFLSLILHVMPEPPCSEISYEIGCYFLQEKDYDQASRWFEAAYQSKNAIIDVRRSGNLPLLGLSRCYRELAERLTEKEPESSDYINFLLEQAALVEEEAENWQIPVE